MTPKEFEVLDKAINKILSDNPEVVNEGRVELDDLLRKGLFDDALFFWRADAYAQAYSRTKEDGNIDKRMLEQAISDYKRLIATGYYEHLRAQLKEWENELKTL